MNKNRISTISKMMDKDSIVLDIGTDHALVPIFLIENKISKKVYATEINKGPFDNAIKNITDKKLLKSIIVKKGDGVIPFIDSGINVDILSITGMGTNLIISILEQVEVPFWNKVVLESTNDSPKLRQWLKSNKYYIEEEVIIKESNKYNSVIKAKISKKTNIKSTFDIQVGPQYNSKNNQYQLVVEALNSKLNHYQSIYETSGKNDHKREIKRLKGFLEKVILINSLSSPEIKKTRKENTRIESRWKKK